MAPTRSSEATANDTIRGGDGSDRLVDGSGVDHLSGRRGGDTLIDGGAGERDISDGGRGTDILSYEERTTPVRATINGSEEDRSAAIEALRGGTATAMG